MRIKTVLFALLFIVNSAFAQIEPDEKTLTFFKSRQFGEQIIMMGLIIDKSLLGMEQCKGSYGFDPISFSIIQPLSFDSTQPQPVSGIWTYRFLFKRCNQTKVYNIQWTAKANGTPTPSVLSPGYTRASQLLFNDLRNGIGAAGVTKFGVPSDCRSLKILDTKISSEPKTRTVAGISQDAVWEEQWVAKMCEQEFTASICLVPMVDGSTKWSIGKCPQ